MGGVSIDPDPFYYDPWADPQPLPWPPEMYEGTGIEGLYATVTPGWVALELLGWTLGPPPDQTETSPMEDS